MQAAECVLLRRLDDAANAPGTGIDCLADELVLAMLRASPLRDIVQFALTCRRYLTLCQRNADALGLLDGGTLAAVCNTEQRASLLHHYCDTLMFEGCIDMCSSRLGVAGDSHLGECVLTGTLDGSVSYFSEDMFDKHAQEASPLARLFAVQRRLALTTRLLVCSSKEKGAAYQEQSNYASRPRSRGGTW